MNCIPVQVLPLPPLILDSLPRSPFAENKNSVTKLCEGIQQISKLNASFLSNFLHLWCENLQHSGVITGIFTVLRSLGPEHCVITEQETAQVNHTGIHPPHGTGGGGGGDPTN